VIPVFINQIEFIVKENISIIEACKYVGIKIPRFCYHESLSIAGNCRMCLVLVGVDKDGLLEEKLFLSCLNTVAAEMQIITVDPLLSKVREEIIEFLLLNHPLDCPICDQAGECDLQDQSKYYGSNKNKYYFNKRPVEDKTISIFIKTIMTRCIHCTRCVRFFSELSGNDLIGTLARGSSTEIGLYTKNFVYSEISGNVIDLCPVGALTSKPYAFKARPWELKSSESFDLTDGLGSSIYVNFNENHVYRILPKYNDALNGSIISDKARYFYDCFDSSSLLKTPIFDNKETTEILNILNLKDKLKTLSFSSKNNILFLVSHDISLEEAAFLRNLHFSYPNIKIKSVYSNNFESHKNFYINANKSLASIDFCLGAIFIIASNLKTENAIINTRVRKLLSTNYFYIVEMGFKVDSTLKGIFVNLGVEAIIKFAEGRSSLSSYFFNADKPLVIIGSSFNDRNFNVYQYENLLKKINPGVVFIKLFLYSNALGLKYMNFNLVNSQDIVKAKTIFLIKCRESFFIKRIFFGSNLSHTLKIWISSYCFSSKTDKLIQIPISGPYSQTSTFMNLESRPQQIQKLFANNLNLLNLKSVLGFIFFFKIANKNKQNNFLREYIKTPQKYYISSNSNYYYLNFLLSKISADLVLISNYPSKPKILDFFKTSYFSDYSKNMSLASKEFKKNSFNFI
jgi:NADH-quinone oxidoreductase subunit G